MTIPPDPDAVRRVCVVLVELGLIESASIQDVQRNLHVNYFNAARLIELGDKVRGLLGVLDQQAQEPETGWRDIEKMQDGIKRTTGHRLSCRKFTPPSIKMFPGDLVFDDDKPCTCKADPSLSAPAGAK